ncbi:MAG: peptidoglycan-binding domain-containing protein, partial [Maritimibacter sp.]
MFRSRSLIEAVLGILLFLCLRVPAQAYEADVKCLQEQLREAGLNVGAIDGLIGSRTLRALAKFKQKNPDFA